MSEYVSVADAALLVDKDRSRIYAWIRAGDLAEYETPEGEKRVRGADVLALAATKRTGRPAGTARPPTALHNTAPIVAEINHVLSALAEQLAAATSTVNRYLHVADPNELPKPPERKDHADHTSVPKKLHRG